MDKQEGEVCSACKGTCVGEAKVQPMAEWVDAGRPMQPIQCQRCKGTGQEPEYSVSCSICGFGEYYVHGEYVPEDCPSCGEHKEFVILALAQLDAD